MTQSNAVRKIVKALAKGQVTIPVEFRDALRIGPEALLVISLVGEHLEMMPLANGDEGPRRYTQGEVSRFVEEDKLDPEIRQRVWELLRAGEM